VLRKSHLSAEFTFTPALTSIDVSVTNSAATRTNTTNTFCISIQRIPLHTGTPRRWRSSCGTRTFGRPRKGSPKSGREFSGKLAKDLRRGQVRIESLDKELFTELWVPLAGNMTVGELEAIAGH